MARHWAWGSQAGDGGPSGEMETQQDPVILHMPPGARC